MPGPKPGAAMKAPQSAPQAVVKDPLTVPEQPPAPAVEFPDLPRKAPPRFQYLWNRLDQPYEGVHSGVTYQFKPHEAVLLPDEAAELLWVHSMLKWDLDTNRGVRALAKPEDADYGVPLVVENRVELVDRSTNANPIGWASPAPTRVVALSVAGAKEAMMERPDKPRLPGLGP